MYPRPGYLAAKRAAIEDTAAAWIDVKEADTLPLRARLVQAGSDRAEEWAGYVEGGLASAEDTAEFLLPLLHGGSQAKKGQQARRYAQAKAQDAADSEAHAKRAEGMWLWPGWQWRLADILWRYAVPLAVVSIAGTFLFTPSFNNSKDQ